MGRKKPGKPRRPRGPRQYTLQELQPPGEGYDEWFRVQPGMQPPADSGLSQDAADLMQRLAGLGALYGGRVPKAALYLDELIERGSLPVVQGETASLVPVEEMAELMGAMDDGSVRESLHELHAAGALLVITGPDEDLLGVRIVAKRPSSPGLPWQFVGDPDTVAATTCIPTDIWEELPLDVAATVAYLRTCRSRLEEPDPEAYGRREGVRDTEHAKELFAAALASGYVDEKGCEACPTGHLCTRAAA
ncbi:hypothetical protein [Streptomyces sp. NBC_00557]|uniref:hypothetical protein n=1 Tax=Streptomyces sp. NBC_00557 TaxID=2975776 RepID=UPI002E813769|nr:hypothetical protein [Streptomyces sp. NBC_00557]WUC39705.1 hypothetical protein OG956_38760 [Streptomyces sp. NBC_00557]